MELSEALIKFTQYFIQMAGKYAENYGIAVLSSDEISLGEVVDEKINNIFKVKHITREDEINFFAISYGNQVILSRNIHIDKFNDSRSIVLRDGNNLLLSLEYDQA